MSEIHDMVGQNRMKRGAGDRICKQKYNPNYVVPNQPALVDYRVLFENEDSSE